MQVPLRSIAQLGPCTASWTLSSFSAENHLAAAMRAIESQLIIPSSQQDKRGKWKAAFEGQSSLLIIKIITAWAPQIGQSVRFKVAGHTSGRRGSNFGSPHESLVPRKVRHFCILLPSQVPHNPHVLCRTLHLQEKAPKAMNTGQKAEGQLGLLPIIFTINVN